MNLFRATVVLAALITASPAFAQNARSLQCDVGSEQSSREPFTVSHNVRFYVVHTDSQWGFPTTGPRARISTHVYGRWVAIPGQTTPRTIALTTLDFDLVGQQLQTPTDIALNSLTVETGNKVRLLANGTPFFETPEAPTRMAGMSVSSRTTRLAFIDTAFVFLDPTAYRTTYDALVAGTLSAEIVSGNRVVARIEYPAASHAGRQAAYSAAQQRLSASANAPQPPNWCHERR